MKRGIYTLGLIFILLMLTRCARYNEIKANINNFEARYEELTDPPKQQVAETQKKKKPKKLYNRRHAPPVYDEEIKSESEQGEEEIIVAPEPIEPVGEPIEKQQSKIKKSKASSLWMSRVLQGGLAYTEVAQKAVDIRLLKLAEEYSKQSIALMWNAESLLDVSGADAVTSIQTWLDEFIIPELTQKKPQYYRGQDAFESIQKTISQMESYQDRMCAFSEGANFFSSKAHLEYAIALLKEKLYDESIVQSRKAFSFLGSKKGEELDCKDVDRDRILVPFDLCPYSPEDRDGDEDEDGCPEFDVEFD